MSRRVIAGVGLAMLAAGCTIGPRVETFAPATSPAGIDLTMQLGGRQVAGELLAVEDTALLLVIRMPSPESTDVPRLARIATRRITNVPARIAPRGAWSSEHTARLRPLARYPQGVTTELEARLAAAYQVPRAVWFP